MVRGNVLNQYFQKTVVPFNKWFVLAVLWWIGGVYALIFRENTGVDLLPFPYFDKYAHVMLFFAQIWLLIKAYLVSSKPIPYKILFIFALICAVLSEWAQAVFTVSRQADFWDGVADMTGTVAALYFARKIEISKINSKKNHLNS